MSAFPLLFLAAAGAAAPPAPPTIPPAVLDESLEVTGETLEAEQRRNRLSVEVRLNGEGPYRFLVDSGADRTVVGALLAADLGLEPGPTVRMTDMAGTAIVSTARIEALDLGTSRIDALVAPVLPETYLGAQGILGIDALEEQRLMLDFDRRTITVQEASRPVLTTADEIVVVARRRNGQLILTEVTAGNQRLFAIIDTGSEITIGNSALRRKLFGTRTPPNMTPITLTSVSGQTIEAQLATIPLVKVGRLRLEGVLVAFADVPPFALFGLKDEPALLLGIDLLKAFRRVSLDFQNRKVRFQLRREPLGR